jgi:hypothetical protein
VTPKLGDGIHAIRRLGYEVHVRFRGEDRGETLAEHRMILDAQDANLFCLRHGSLSAAAVYIFLKNEMIRNERRQARMNTNKSALISSVILDGIPWALGTVAPLRPLGRQSKVTPAALTRCRLAPRT